VLGELVQHVVEEANARIDVYLLRRSHLARMVSAAFKAIWNVDLAAVQADNYRYLGLICLARYLGCTGRASRGRRHLVRANWFLLIFSMLATRE
jgi:hypothetical protein